MWHFFFGPGHINKKSFVWVHRGKFKTHLTFISPFYRHKKEKKRDKERDRDRKSDKERIREERERSTSKKKKSKDKERERERKSDGEKGDVKVCVEYVTVFILTHYEHCSCGVDQTGGALKCPIHWCPFTDHQRL